jgi:ABC-2 type transport system permease protein
MSALLAFQLRRVGRNRQYLLFTVLLPALFTVFFVKVFGGQAGRGEAYQDFAATYMVSMMAYGALGAALGATIRLSFDRASGWLRQLHVLPVPTSRIFTVDVVVGALLTLPSLLVVGGLWVPVEIFPAGLRSVAHGLPSYWYAQLGRDVAAGGGPSAAAVLALAGFTAVFAALAVLVARRRPLHAVSG